jgi:hypothetical protein
MPDLDLGGGRRRTRPRRSRSTNALQVASSRPPARRSGPRCDWRRTRPGGSRCPLWPHPEARRSGARSCAQTCPYARELEDADSSGKGIGCERRSEVVDPSGSANAGGLGRWCPLTASEVVEIEKAALRRRKISAVSSRAGSASKAPEESSRAWSAEARWRGVRQLACRQPRPGPPPSGAFGPAAGAVVFVRAGGDTNCPSASGNGTS